MSWYKSLTVDVTDGIHTIEAELDRLFSHKSIVDSHSGTNVPAESVIAAKQAATLIAKTLPTSGGQVLGVTISGHQTTPGVTTTGDVVNVSIGVGNAPTPTATL